MSTCECRGSNCRWCRPPPPVGEQGFSETEVEVMQLRERVTQAQATIDACVHYRNLAIHLGAKPDDMIGRFDRELCEGWDGDSDEKANGERQFRAEMWRECEAAEERADRAESVLCAAVFEVARDMAAGKSPQTASTYAIDELLQACGERGLP